VARRRRALARLQASFDGAYQRRSFAERREKLVALQAYAKMWYARRGFLEVKRAQTEIARHYRGCVERRYCRRRRAAARTLGTGLRCLAVRAWYHRRRWAARQIQTAWLRRLDLREASEQLAAVARIQSAWRMQRLRRQHLAVRRAGELLVNATMMRRHMRLHRQRVAAVTTIATAWRGYACRRNLASMVRSAVMIQGWWQTTCTCRSVRDHAVTVLVKAKLLKEAYFGLHALAIQRWFRSWSQRPTQSSRMVRAVTRLQAQARRRRAMKEAGWRRAVLGFRVKRLLSQQVVLERDAQGRLTRLRGLREAERGPGSRIGRVVDIKALSGPQRKALADAVAPLQAAMKWHLYLRAVTTIQRTWRGLAVRKTLRRRGEAATRIQAAWRGHRAYAEFNAKRCAVGMIQANARGVAARVRVGQLAMEEAVPSLR